MKKKNIFLNLCMVVFSFVIGISSVSASKITCKYPYHVKGPIVITYEYGKKLSVTPNSASMKLTSNSLKNSDFYDKEGKVLCPSISVKATPTDKGRYKYTITKGSKIKGNVSNEQQDNKEKQSAGGVSNNNVCYYNEGSSYEYSISYLNGKAVVNAEANHIKDWSFIIRNCDDAKLFGENNCPTVYDHNVSKGKQIIIDCKNKIFSDNDKPTDAGTSENVDTGEKTKPDNTGGASLESRIKRFADNTIGATATCSASDKVCLKKQLDLYDEAKEISKLCNDVYADVTIDDKTSKKYEACNNTFETKMAEFSKAGYFGNRIITGNTSGNACDNTLGSLGEWLTKIFKLMLLAVPVIIMVFGFKDFIKALLSGKDDELKKSGSTFIKRLIFGAVFVALPMIIKVILTIALGGDFADICIL